MTDRTSPVRPVPWPAADRGRPPGGPPKAPPAAVPGGRDPLNPNRRPDAPRDPTCPPREIDRSFVARLILGHVFDVLPGRPAEVAQVVMEEQGDREAAARRLGKGVRYVDTNMDRFKKACLELARTDAFVRSLVQILLGE